jgi:hypothetical protein
MVTTARADSESPGSDFRGKRGGGSAARGYLLEAKRRWRAGAYFQMGPSGFRRWGLGGFAEKRGPVLEDDRDNEGGRVGHTARWNQNKRVGVLWNF